MSRNRRDDFNAGFSAAYIALIIVMIVASHGHHDGRPVSWGDIIWFLLMAGIFANCVVDVYKYRQVRKNEPEWSIVVRFDSLEERTKFIKGELK